MGLVYKDECCQCAVPGYPCTGEHRRVPHYYCDKCEEEFEPDELYVTPDGEFCDKCILNEFDTIAQVEERG